MPKLSERGVAHLLVLIILLLGLVAAVYLTTSGNPLKLFSSAAIPPIVFKSLDGNPLPITRQGVTQTTSPNVRVELTSTLGPPAGSGSAVSGPVKTGTAFYRAGFDLAQLSRAPFVPYQQEPTVLNVTLKNTIGIQFYWVEFKGASGKTDWRSAQIQVVPVGGIPAPAHKTCTVNWLSVPNNPAPYTDVILAGQAGVGDFSNAVFSIDNGSWRNDFNSVNTQDNSATVKMSTGPAGDSHNVRVATNNGKNVCTPAAAFTTGNYCTDAGYHVCTVGNPAGGCVNGKQCFETYQCNFGGQNYCNTSNCVSCTSPTPTPTSGLEVGLEAGEQHDNSRVGLVAESGAAWARLNFVGTDWSADSSDVNTYNSIINSYLKRNIKIIGVIGAQSVSGGYNRNDSGSFTQKYVNVADAIVDRFGDRVKNYELFNEPNDWAGRNTAQVSEKYFAQYLGRIYRQIKIVRGRSDINLNSGPLFSHDLDTGASYLANTYSAGKQLTDTLANWEEIKRQTGSYPLDGIGYHVYVAQGMADQGQVENKIRGNLDAVKKVIASQDPGKKVWITEFGWGTGGRVTEDVQAQNLEKAFAVFKADTTVKMAMWFTLMDFDSAEWGLIRSDGRKKLGWVTFQKITGVLR